MVRCRDCVYWALLDPEKGYRRCYVRYEHMTRRRLWDRDCPDYVNHLEACAEIAADGESML
jgi:hypothetical protein